MRKKFKKKQIRFKMQIYWRRFANIIKLIGFFLFITYFLYILCTHLFNIKEIEVIGEGVNIQINPEKLNKNLLFFPSEIVKKDILNNYIQLEDITFTKVFPHTLQVIVKVRKPLARIKTVEKIYLVDEKGIVLGDASISDSKYPLVFTEISNLIQGTYIKDEKIFQILSFIKSLDEVVQIREISIINGSSIQARLDKTDIICMLKKDMMDCSDTLQTLITRFRMKGTMPARIDLRFDKPVVTF
ncbi:cell division protein FtsQ/DivIB [Patescibacteria group bacterium]